MMARWVAGSILGLGLGLISTARAEDTPLSIADLEAYRVALASKPGRDAPRVGFRDLWDRPGDFAGKPVQVEGRVARVFRQAGVGEFPPLAEVWVVSKAGDPFCLVFPLASGASPPAVGEPVEFSGTFLKRLRYQGGDAARAAPLVVGPEPPRWKETPGGSSWSVADWVLGLGAAVLVAAVLARRHLSRPVSRPISIDPTPLFLDGGASPADPDPDEGGSIHVDSR